MDPRAYLDELHLPDHLSSPKTAVISGLMAIYFAYQIFLYFNIAIISPRDILWNVLVYATPTHLLLDAEKRREIQANNMLSQTHAAKAEALVKVFASKTFWPNFPTAGIKRRASTYSKPTTDAPPGLGNWDNSCYQNSVLQGLAALQSLRPHLDQTRLRQLGNEGTTTASLQETLIKLNDPTNNGRQLWTPATLKSMSSWQQQDAQEYFSKIMDELDKEAAKAAFGEGTNGLEHAVQGDDTNATDENDTIGRRNPLEGLLAQRVACTRCGFSEGLSMIPFNCMTVSLGPDFAYSLGQCLNEYTKLEYINEVDCTKCTLLRAEQQLQQMIPRALPQGSGKAETDTKTFSLPPEVRALVMKRLQAIEKAIEDDDFAEKTLSDKCQIPKKAHVSSTKTKQAVIGRAPQTLAIHVNRSMFDEMTGMQRKNYASVQYPLSLNLGPWMMNNSNEDEDEDTERLQSFRSRASLLSPVDSGDGPQYRLQAVVTHYGRHENGHYICYRRHATLRVTELEDTTAKDPYPAERWWRLSDEDVSAATEDDVLNQSGVFMLFYEREYVQPPARTTDAQSGNVVECTADSTTTDEVTIFDEITFDPILSNQGAVEDGSEQETSIAHIASNLATENVPQNPIGITADESISEDQTEHAETPDSSNKTVTPKPAQVSPTPTFMRTARGRQSSTQYEDPFGSTIRQMAAT